MLLLETPTQLQLSAEELRETSECTMFYSLYPWYIMNGMKCGDSIINTTATYTAAVTIKKQHM